MIVKKCPKNGFWGEYKNSKEDEYILDELAKWALGEEDKEEEDKPVNGNTYSAPYTPPIKSKRGRPSKGSKVASGYTRVAIDVLANGYCITVNDGKSPDNFFVFNKLQDVHDWLRDNMHPTYMNAKFMESL